MSTMNFYQTIQAAINQTCCFCGKTLTELTDFCDPTPAYSPEPPDSKVCCRRCYNKVVPRIRLAYLRKESIILFGRDPEDYNNPYMKQEALDEGVCRLLVYQKVVHHSPEKNTVSCGIEIPNRGKAARSARMGKIDEITCPQCLKILNARIEKIPKPDPGTEPDPENAAPREESV